jgi:DeoR/GlpR family transcriptional regulator of sugar metabolism
VTVLGGRVLRDELHCVGPVAVRTLERFRFDLAIVGAAGLSERWGLTELTDEEAEVQRTAIDRAERVVVIADGSKLGAVTPAVVAAAARIDAIVTDASAPPTELDALAANGREIVVAGAARDGRRRASTAPDHAAAADVATVTAPA